MKSRPGVPVVEGLMKGKTWENLEARPLVLPSLGPSAALSPWLCPAAGHPVDC